MPWFAWLPLVTVDLSRPHSAFPPTTKVKQKRSVKSLPLRTDDHVGKGLQVALYRVDRVPEWQSAAVQDRRWVLSGRSSSPSRSHDGKRLETGRPVAASIAAREFSLFFCFL